jgi:ParB/RepB/Spo0J family partition protein
MFLHLDPRAIIDENRQRVEYGDISGLAASIKQHGQLQPIVVEALPGGAYRLIAGGRRLRAALSLQLPAIAAVFLTDLTEAQRELIELEENVRRKDLEWQEYVLGIERYIVARLRTQPASTVEEIAASIQISPSSISIMRTVAEVLHTTPDAIKSASSWRSAYDSIMATKRKKESNILEDVLSAVLRPQAAGLEATADTAQLNSLSLLGVTEEQLPPALVEAPVLNQSFLSWVPTYDGQRFNLIHCDFPYGLSMDTANLQGSATHHDRYDDAPELFDALVKAFFEHQDQFIASSAHCIFWLAHKNFGRIHARFRYHGWAACEVPLIWHKSDGAGIAPDVRRQPRRTYEIAIFASRGDRPIRTVKAASFANPTTKEHHLSEKPLPVVTHFLEMVCDEYSVMLDPTCGSGTALEAAKRLGAQSVTGLDVLQQHVDYSNRRLARL